MSATNGLILIVIKIKGAINMKFDLNDMIDFFNSTSARIIIVDENDIEELAKEELKIEEKEKI